MTHHLSFDVSLPKNMPEGGEPPSVEQDPYVTMDEAIRELQEQLTEMEVLELPLARKRAWRSGFLTATALASILYFMGLLS